MTHVSINRLIFFLFVLHFRDNVCLTEVINYIKIISASYTFSLTENEAEKAKMTMKDERV